MVKNKQKMPNAGFHTLNRTGDGDNALDSGGRVCHLVPGWPETQEALHDELACVGSRACGCLATGEPSVRR